MGNTSAPGKNKDQPVDEERKGLRETPANESEGRKTSEGGATEVNGQASNLGKSMKSHQQVVTA